MLLDTENLIEERSLKLPIFFNPQDPSKQPTKTPTTQPSKNPVSPSPSGSPSKSYSAHPSASPRSTSCLAKKVKLQSTSSTALHMFEVNVFSGGLNVAKNKVASQSSTFNDNEIKFGAGRAVDGHNQTFSHTALLENSWWEVDLQSMVNVESVNVLNRYCGWDTSDPHGCLCRLSGALVQLIDDNGVVLSTSVLGDTCESLTVLADFSHC
jgi:hypothetical protein